MSKNYYVIFLLGIIFSGCNHRRIEYRDQYAPLRVPGLLEYTEKGTPVWVPFWLHKEPSIKTLVFKEIDETKPDFDTRLDSNIVGAPPGFTVIIQDPGAFSTTASNTGLAVGYTDMRANIYVAWRRFPTDTLFLPALGHEYRHVYTGDINAGH